eukprot:4708740-Amphidinium_carterae.1
MASLRSSNDTKKLAEQCQQTSVLSQLGSSFTVHGCRVGPKLLVTSSHHKQIFRSIPGSNANTKASNAMATRTANKQTTTLQKSKR